MPNTRSVLPQPFPVITVSLRMTATVGVQQHKASRVQSVHKLCPHVCWYPRPIMLPGFTTPGETFRSYTSYLCLHSLTQAQHDNRQWPCRTIVNSGPLLISGRSISCDSLSLRRHSASRISVRRTASSLLAFNLWKFRTKPLCNALRALAFCFN